MTQGITRWPTNREIKRPKHLLGRLIFNMNSSAITFPIFVSYTDKEVAFFVSSDAFFDTSGCEEEDFADDVDQIFDSQGMRVHYVPNPNTAQDRIPGHLDSNGEELAAKSVEAIFTSHFGGMSPERLSEFTEQSSGLSLEKVIDIGRRLL